MLLACVPLATAKAPGAYPTENVAEYVVNKVNVKVLPEALRPKPKKGKQTFADYGFVTSKVDDREAALEGPNGTSRISISILQESKSGIYVCLNGAVQKQGAGRIQRVLLLKHKNSDSLLGGWVSSKEFEACPVIGATQEEVPVN
jgi:hypothetical protein